jgi:hypothetical protein
LLVKFPAFCPHRPTVVLARSSMHVGQHSRVSPVTSIIAVFFPAFGFEQRASGQLSAMTLECLQFLQKLLMAAL